MTTRLHIGLTHRQPGWSILLDQIGVDWSTAPGGDAPYSPEEYSVVIVTAVPSAAERAAIERYRSAGGAVLDCNALRSGGFPRFVRTLFPDASDPLFGDVPLLDLSTVVRTRRQAQHLCGAVALEQDGSPYAWLGLPVNNLILDTRRRRKLFYAPSGLFPNELTALVAKGALRQVVTALLKELHFRRGLPFAHRRLFPSGSASVFCFRIDSDGGSREQVRTWCDIADRHGIPMSWFLHLERFTEWLDVFRSYPAQEVGIHSVVHKTFGTYEENRRNIEHAREILDAESFLYRGYSAPYGTWNTGVALAEEHHGFTYASEFSLNYDDVPFRPWVRNRLSPVLQVPIHPVCIGSLQRVGMTEEEMAAYYRFAADTKLCDDEPLIFYDHPLHPYPGVLDTFFGYIRSLSIPTLSFADYAAWWLRRLQARTAVHWNGRDCTVTAEGSDDVWLDVWTSFSSRRMLAPDGTSHEPPPVEAQRPERSRNIRDIRRFSGAVLRQTVIDLYNKWRA